MLCMLFADPPSTMQTHLAGLAGNIRPGASRIGVQIAEEINNLQQK